MKVFVAGATGVLGKRAVRELVAAGHDVTGVARSAEKAALLRSLGATPVEVDVFDAAAVKDAVVGHDVVCNLATHIPPTTKMAFPGAWEENNRIRSEASRNLVDAAIAAGATRYIQESICFMYGDHGDEWIDEETPLDVPGIGRSLLDAEAAAGRFTESGGTGVVLRFGGFYGPDSGQIQDFVRLARNHLAPMLGSKAGYLPMIHLDDTGTAVVAALDVPAGVYNVTDETTTRGEQAQALAEAVGVRRLVAAPEALTKIGPMNYAARSMRVSNKRFKEATGWKPRYPTTREGWPAVVSAMGGASSPTVGLLARLGLLLLALPALQIGVWATAAPHSFFNSFPGGGRHWVAVDGPFNEHLVRDFGAMNLAIAFLLLVALVAGSRLLVTTAAVSYLLFAVPHFGYHLANMQVLDTADQWANGISLAFSVLIPVAVIVSANRSQRAQTTSVASSSRKSLVSP
ncbi:MAG: NAD-dependent epimerase/dehydratase [Acidimicrobiales bacterium]|nr:NAD-dependent epimerase/dehydratase [Acidimicrobiales bacterium]